MAIAGAIYASIDHFQGINSKDGAKIFLAPCQINKSLYN
jgi:hypothetical protein